MDEFAIKAPLVTLMMGVADVKEMMTMLMKMIGETYTGGGYS